MANDPHFFTDGVEGKAGGPLGLSESNLALEPGLVLGGEYRLLRPAGFGGMGTVWVARNESTAAEVAVKVLVTAHQAVNQKRSLASGAEANGSVRTSVSAYAGRMILPAIRYRLQRQLATVYDTFRYAYLRKSKTHRDAPLF